MTPRELAWHITDTHDYFVSESSVYRILKVHDLLTGLQFTVMLLIERLEAASNQVSHTWPKAQY
jgi:putative transposase